MSTLPTNPSFGIRKLRIHNFRGIESLDLDFTRPNDEPSEIVVIAGPNGCGKTTVLEACLVALDFQGELQDSEGRYSTRVGASSWEIDVEVKTPHGIYQGRISGRGGRQQELNRRWTRLDPVQESLPLHVPCVYFSSWRAPKLVGSLSISAGRQGRRPRETERNRIVRIKQHLINGKAYLSMMQPVSPEGPDFYLGDLRQLNEVWATFYPDSRDVFEVGPAGSDADAGFDVFLTGPSRPPVPVDALSSGQLELFALFGSLMLAKINDAIIVIDEPELHLDPQWHALMLRAIRHLLPNAQLLVATHSPRVYDSVLSFQRHFLIPDTDPRSHVWNIEDKEVVAR